MNSGVQEGEADMKVVLFCGGYGTRMRGQVPDKPKPLVDIGGHALMWHVMRYYAHHGHTDFILCLGYGADAITEYFQEQGAEVLPTISTGRRAQSFLLPDDDNGHWNVTLVDTGIDTSIGQRLKAIESYVDPDEMFLANYADGLTDLPLQNIIDCLVRKPASVGALVAVKPTHSFHYIRHDSDGTVTGVESSTDIDVRINGGYFVFRREIFDYIGEGDDLVEQPFHRLIGEQRLLAYPYDGFWRACDTLKDVHLLEEVQRKGKAPWETWREACRDSLSVHFAAGAVPLGAASVSPAA
jgi:glucose-1-phosphate cytidylyltransferase